MSLAARVCVSAFGAVWIAACAQGIENPLDLESAGGAGGSPVGGVAGTGGAGPSTGGAGPSTGGAGPSAGGNGGVTGTGGTGGAGSSTGGSSAGGAGGAGGSGVDASAGGSAGTGGQGGATMDASIVDVFDAGSPKDVAPEVPCPGAGTALSFDLTKSQYVVIPGAAMPAGATPRTIEMWVLNKSPIANWAPNHTLWEYGTGNLGTFAMDFDNVGNPRRMELYVNPSANSFFFDSGMMQDTWFHVAGSYDGGTKTHAFINGVEIGTGFTITGPLVTPTNQPLYVGAGTVRNYLTGSIDEVRIWNVARTAAQIARDMNFRLVGNEAGLVGYYRFDEGSGTTARDATSGANNGTLTNGPTYVQSGVALGCR
jgi:hypothetical protein